MIVYYCVLSMSDGYTKIIEKWFEFVFERLLGAHLNFRGKLGGLIVLVAIVFVANVFVSNVFVANVIVADVKLKEKVHEII